MSKIKINFINPNPKEAFAKHLTDRLIENTSNKNKKIHIKKGA